MIRAASATNRPIVGFDATPIVDLRPSSGHGVRGIGRYLSGVLDALLTECAGWSAAHLRLLTAPGQSIDLPPGMSAPWTTRRPGPRPQDIGFITGAMADRLALRGERPTMWHLTDPWRPIGPLPASRTVVTVHDLIPLLEPSILSRLRPHRRAVYRLYLDRVRKARMVIVNSEVTAGWVRELLGVGPDRLWVVRPRITAPEPDEKAWGRGAIDSRDRVDLLFVGVPQPHKQPELAIQTLATCRRRGMEAHLTFAGVMTATDRDQLAALVGRSGVAGRVGFAGRVADAELARRYRRSVLLAVSRLEGLGLPAAEAVLAGGRVVAGSAAVYREVLGDAAVYATEDVADAVADAVRIALAGPPSDAARERVAARFSSAASAAASVAAYEAAW